MAMHISVDIYLSTLIGVLTLVLLSQLPAQLQQQLPRPSYIYNPAAGAS